MGRKNEHIHDILHVLMSFLTWTTKRNQLVIQIVQLIERRKKNWTRKKHNKIWITKNTFLVLIPPFQTHSSVSNNIQSNWFGRK